MAKVGLWLRGSKGKFAGGVLGKGKGGATVLRELKAPSNPKTLGQMTQRMKFAQVAKFFSHATKALFQFAYEDRRKQESDYNAFMRHNLVDVPAVRKVDYDNPKYPSIGHWMLSQGTLVDPDVDISANAKLCLAVDTAETAVSTVAGASNLILNNYPKLIEGDIVTFVVYRSELLPSNKLNDVFAPEMVIAQFVLDTTDTTTLESIGLDTITEGGENLMFNALYSETASAGAVIFSRKSADGLKCSTSKLIGNAIWEHFCTDRLAVPYTKDSAMSWGAREEAILEGALANQEGSPFPL